MLSYLMTEKIKDYWAINAIKHDFKKGKTLVPAEIHYAF